MPCDAIRQTSVDLTVASPGLLATALRDLGLTATASGSMVSFAGTLKNGTYLNGYYSNSRLTLYGDMDTAPVVNTIKKAYSHAAVKQQAKKYGWTLKQTGDTYVVTKR